MFGNGLHLIVPPTSYAQWLEELRVPLPPAEPDLFIDWAGVRTRTGMLPWAPDELAGTTSADLPIPSDGYRSEAEEYVGLAVALAGAGETFTMIEVGAGWAPWAVMGAVCARRLGKQARCIAVEADPTKADWAAQHALDNGLTPEEFRLIRAACWHTEGTLRFPVLDADDMGGAVTPESGVTMDYRGAHFAHVDVPAVSLHSLIDDPIPTDLLHIDLQGMELQVLLPTLEAIEQHVRFLAVGTHDRYVEGMLQKTLLAREWALLMESTSTAVFDGVKPTLAGFTVQDGNQFYANSRFRDADPRIIRYR